MPRGRTSTLRITLTPKERAYLEHVLRQRSQPTSVHQRVRMVLLRAEGLPIVHIGTRIGMATPHIYRWLRAWQRARLASLAGPGRNAAKGDRHGRELRNPRERYSITFVCSRGDQVQCAGYAGLGTVLWQRYTRRDVLGPLYE
jgi:hypothetical protein